MLSIVKMKSKRIYEHNVSDQCVINPNLVWNHVFWNTVCLGTTYFWNMLMANAKSNIALKLKLAFLGESSDYQPCSFINRFSLSFVVIFRLKIID